MLCSGKIAGEGLNLTEANNVIFLNEWWNPSSNNQARDRVHRIGQDKSVSIFNLRTKNTVEESLAMILSEKKKISDWIEQNNFETATFDNLDQFYNINDIKDLQKIES